MSGFRKAKPNPTLDQDKKIHPAQAGMKPKPEPKEEKAEEPKKK